MRTACITGASRGLGKATAEFFFKSGWKVALVSRSPKILEDLAENLCRDYCRNRLDILVIGADLSVPGSAKYCVDVMKDHWRVLNALVNNAGVQGPIGPFCDIDSDAWSEAFKTLLFAPLDMCRMAIPWMASAGGGDIVNLSGGGAAGPRENFTAYSAAKTALVRTTENLAVEYARCGVSVNAVAPGIMPTGLLREVLDAGPDLAGAKDYEAAEKAFENGAGSEARAAECVYALCDQTPPKITGKLISAVWDPWRDLARYAGELASSDVYTLRRVTPESRGKKAGY